MSNRVEPPLVTLRDWADGIANVAGTPYHYANWAYWYLGFDDPTFRADDMIINQSVVVLTEACRLRLAELERNDE